MTELHVPDEIFQHLARAFIHEEGCELADNYKAGGLARPSDDFGDLFAWAWQTDRDLAMQILAQLLKTANASSDLDEPISAEQLLDGLRYSLHRTHYAREYEYSDIRDMAERELPDLLPDLDD